MLPKINRLKTKKDIDRVFKKGIGVKEGFLILKAVKSDLKNPRFAFIVSQKVSKKATLRNKIRRRLSGLVKQKLPGLRPGMDIVLVAAPGLAEKDFWEIDETINKLFAKAKIFEGQK